MSNRAVFTVTLISAVIASLAGFFASASPDGLEKVAGNLSFEHKAATTPGAFVDYTVSFISHSSFSTALAGLIGIIIIFFIFRAISRARSSSIVMREISRYPLK
ncbi:MAG: PDGLE domain-containing protein [bacterium]